MEKSNILKASSDGYRSYTADELLSLKRTFCIDGTIDDKNSVEIVKTLLALDQENHDEITMIIHSPGGNIQEGLAIIETMHMIKSPVRTVAIGVVASMGAVIFANGERGRRCMYPSSKLLIHEPLVMDTGTANVSQIIEMGNSMQQVKKLINRILATCTGRTEKEIDRDTKSSRMFEAEEAIAYGLADYRMMRWE